VKPEAAWRAIEDFLGEMEQWYHRLRDQQWREHDARAKGGENWLRALDALYLGGTIGTEAILRGNGEVWIRTEEPWVDSKTGTNEWRPADEGQRSAFLVMASDRIPQLLSLLPSRPGDANDCARCGGGRWLGGQIICPDCNGLGWIHPL
jgi:hypothetical protein